MLELALQTHILAASAISSAIGSRCWFQEPDPTATQLPDVVFERASESQEETHDGDAEDLQFPLYEFTARSLQPSETITLADKVRRQLRLLRTGATVTTTAGDVVVDQLDVLGVTDEPVTVSVDGSERVAYARSILCRIGFRQSTAAP